MTKQPSLPVWTRVILVLVALEALELVVVFYQIDLVKLLVPWPATPLNARFIAALYTSLGIGVLASAFARQPNQVRIILLGIGVATGLLFVITLPYLSGLNPFPTVWMFFYVLDPALVAFAFWRLRGQWGTPPPRANPLAAFWGVQAILLGVSGVFMLFAPAEAVSVWPWVLTVPLAQLYSAFFITLALGCVLAWRDARWSSARLLALSAFFLALMVLGVSLYHLDRFKPGLPTILWFGIFGLECLAFGVLLIYKQVRKEQLE